MSLQARDVEGDDEVEEVKGMKDGELLSCNGKHEGS